MIDDLLSELLGESADPVQAGYHLQRLVQAGPEYAAPLGIAIAAQHRQLERSDPAIVGGLLRVLHTLMLRAPRDQGTGNLDPQTIQRIEASLPHQSSNRYLLLHLLSMQQTDTALRLMVQLLKTEPPKSWIEAGPGDQSLNAAQRLAR